MTRASMDSKIDGTEFYQVLTDDGWTLSLRRFRCAAHAPAASSRPPLMLLHGLAANHRTFHLPGRSLARWLAGRGWDVWLPELRGHGESVFRQPQKLNKSRKSTRTGWTLDDYLRRDLPVIIDAIFAHTGMKTLNWVGHSMGGILLMAYGILHPDAPITRGMAIASALDFSQGDSKFSHLLKVRRLLERFQFIPYRQPMQWLAPAVGRGVPGLQGLHAWPANIEGHTLREIYRSCFDDIPISLLVSMATSFEPGGVCVSDGFCVLEHAARLRFPLRLLGATRDRQVPGPAVVHTAKALGSQVDAMIFGADFDGFDDFNENSAGSHSENEHQTAEFIQTRHHYGHWDLVLGARAPLEVWPVVARWLEE